MARGRGIDWALIEAGLARGLTPREIAVGLGCAVQNVIDRMKRRGWVYDTHTGWKEGAPAGNGGSSGASDGSAASVPA